MYPTRQAPKWVPPLPPGWEAKFDPAQHTYFFINHQTRTTQWEDPRFHQQQQAPAAAPSPGPTASAAATSLSQSGKRSGPASRYESLQMRDFGSVPRGGQSRSQGESSLTNVEAIAQKLQGEFPAATRELISDMLESCQNNESRTRQQLKNLGFGVKPPASSAGRTRTSLSPTGSAKRGASPARRTSRGSSPVRHEQQPKSQTSTPKREVSDHDRARILNQLKGEFPNSDPNVITIAASTCNFDMEQSRELIKAFQNRQSEEERNRGSRGAATSSGHTSAATSQPSQPSQQSLLPAGLGDEPARPMSSGTSQPRRSSHSRGSTPTAHAGGAGDGAARGSRGDGGRQSQPQHARTAQQVTRPRPKQARQTGAVTSQPQVTAPTVHRPVIDSSHRTATAGPNRELRHGPDSSLLMSEYIHAQGPNRDLHSGPDNSRVAGPQGCMGPDVTLICGPQHDLISSQQRDRVVTPSGVLVSNI